MAGDDAKPVAAHDQTESHTYTVHYPAHPARESDPHYKDFDHFHRKFGPTARCVFALQFEPDGAPPPVLGGPDGKGYAKRLIGVGEARAGCDVTHPMELHHAHIEHSLQNGIDLVALEKDYPGISDPDQVGAWVETGANFEWLCVFHHRGHGGTHVAAAAVFEGEHYIRGLVS